MIISKGDRLYRVKEETKKWAVTKEEGMLTVVFEVPKELCKTEEALREYVASNDLF